MKIVIMLCRVVISSLFIVLLILIRFSILIKETWLREVVLYQSSQKKKERNGENNVKNREKVMKMSHKKADSEQKSTRNKVLNK